MMKQSRIRSTKNIDLLGYHTLGWSRMAPSLNEESSRRNKTKEIISFLRRRGRARIPLSSSSPNFQGPPHAFAFFRTRYETRAI